MRLKRSVIILLVLNGGLAYATVLTDFYKAAINSLTEKPADKFIEAEPSRTPNQSGEGYGVRNFTDGYVEVIGYGVGSVKQEGGEFKARAVAEEIARTMAYLKMAETVDGTYINGATTVEDATRLDSDVEKLVRGFIKGAVVKSTEFEKKGDEVGCVVRLRLNLVANPAAIEVIGRSDALGGGTNYTSYEGLITPGGNYSGIIIDARGIPITPALMPRVVTANGQLVYGPEIISPTAYANGGLVAYVRSEREARVVKAGEEPFLVKALKAVGRAACDIVIPDEAAALLNGANKFNSVLADGKVAILTD